MNKLIPQQNRFEYRGLFTKPAFSLWGEGGRILSGLFEAFAPYNRSLSDFRNDSQSLNPSDQVVSVALGPTGQYKFRFDGVELSVTDFTTQDLSILPEILQRADEWLRSAVDGLTFQSHLLSTFSHNRLVDRTSEEFLLSLSSSGLAGVGKNRGTGMIYHWDNEELGWDMQLTLDHSLSVKDGLFLHFIVTSTEDKIEYTSAVPAGSDMFQKALSQLNLEIGGQDQ